MDSMSGMDHSEHLKSRGTVKLPELVLGAMIAAVVVILGMSHHFDALSFIHHVVGLQVSYRIELIGTLIVMIL